MRDLARSTHLAVLSVAGVAFGITVAVAALSLPHPGDLARPTTVVALLMGAALTAGAALLAGWLITAPLRRVAGTLCALVGDAPGHRGTHAGRGQLSHIQADLNLLAHNVQTVMATVSKSTNIVAEASAELAAGGQQIGDGVDDAGRHATHASEAAEGASRNIGTTSTSAREIGRSTRSIADTVAEATQVAAQAVDIAESTNVIVKKLGDSSTEIGNVVKVITKIAGQTNLLALNATIEASRVGDIGKGFAVVATEVKELAQQTAQATEDISRRIAAIQADSAEAVGAMWQIGAVIEQISDFQREIANAVEHQTMITGEVDRDVSAAAGASDDVASAVAALSEALDKTRDAVSGTDRLAAKLAEVAQEMGQAIGVASGV
jgi:methyl-accepting chemotaxis protein